MPFRVVKLSGPVKLFWKDRGQQQQEDEDSNAPADDDSTPHLISSHRHVHLDIRRLWHLRIAGALEHGPLSPGR